MWNYERRSFSLPDAGDVFAKVITPRSTVTVVGPSDSPYRDASGLFVGHLVGQGGKIYIADPNETYVFPDRVSLGGPAVQCGSVMSYLNGIDQFRNSGLSLPPYEWLGQESGIFHIGQQTDILVDHGTTQYIFEVRSYLRDKLSENLIAVAKTYRGALQDDGTLFWQINNKGAGRWGHNLANYIAQALEDVGFCDVKHIQVADVYRIPVSEDSIERIRAVHTASGGTIYDCERFLDHGCLVFDRPHHNCPDMFIARK